MNAIEHETVVRRSFAQQVDVFTGEDSPFARQPAGSLSWLEPLREDMIVLDVACGAAHAAELAAPNVRQVVGLDLTPALLRLAADRLGAAGITNVLLQEGDAADLPFLDASFDLVICRNSLHHFPSPEQPIAEMARVCRPGGRVVLSDMVAPSPDLRQEFDHLHRLIDPSHVGALLDAELAELLRSGVGPVLRRESSGPVSLPIDQMLTEASDRVAVLSALRAELAGGPATGFHPVESDHILVSFSATTLHASWPAA